MVLWIPCIRCVIKIGVVFEISLGMHEYDKCEILINMFNCVKISQVNQSQFI